MLKKTGRRKRKLFKTYSINQCALYKIGSINKLSQVLEIEHKSLKEIIKNPLEYREFPIQEIIDPFSFKKKKARQVQEPFGDLRKIHERILYLLEPVELPDYAHAAVKKRSYRSNAVAHVNSASMATFDLKNFYGKTQSQFVYFFFLDILKCSSDVAGTLTKLTTFRNAMPTGSPLSPLLSLHAAKPMFDELYALARSLDLIFTCYIDDLTFSGKTIPRSLQRHILRIIRKNEYGLSDNKTRIFGEDDTKHVTGLVINKGKLSVPHSRFLTARNIESAIAGKFPMHGYSKLKLLEKRAGLLGEAAYIDASYKELAADAQADLKLARAENKLND